MNKRKHIFHLLIVVMLFLGACNLPSGDQSEEAGLTAAAQTVEALLSATPAITNTNTPFAVTQTITPTPLTINTNTPIASATSNCNVMQFVSDVTIPDGTIITPGQTFTKTWRLRNGGTCTWTPAYAIVFSDGNSMNGPTTQALAGNVNPGQTVDISVNLTAPATPGDYTGSWKIRDAAGVLFGRFYVQIKAQNPATATNTSAPPFAVTSVNFTNTGGCNGFTATASITTNGPGTVTYTWKFDDGATVPNESLTFASAGTQSDSYTWTTSSPGTHWIDVYIITPNNQQFGRASFTCP
ncbi:MAG: hypothetical protein JNM02_09110 [Anaerolineales bacterium]|nr:hypothetical protein [Anaerolineales bacterium]